MKIAHRSTSKPYVPGGQNFDGIPNASPEMLHQEQKMKNPADNFYPTFLEQNVKSGDLKMSLYENILKKLNCRSSGEKMRRLTKKRPTAITSDVLPKPAKPRRSKAK